MDTESGLKPSPEAFFHALGIFRATIRRMSLSELRWATVRLAMDRDQMLGHDPTEDDVDRRVFAIYALEISRRASEVRSNAPA